MEREKVGKSGILYILMVLILFQGISGIFGGGALILDPSGNLLQLPVGMLEGSPFETFLIPGIILFVLLGVFPVVVFVGLWQRKKWAWRGAFLVSLALIIWIGVEIALVGYHSDPPLQLIYGMVGLILLMLMLTPSVRNRLHSQSLNLNK